MWETDVKQRQTSILTHNVFYRQYHVMLSSRPHSTLLLLHGWKGGYSTGGTLLVAAPAGCSPWLEAGIGLDLHWLQLTRTLTRASASASTTWLLPLIYTGASCSEKSPIDCSVNMLIVRYELFLVKNGCSRIVGHKHSLTQRFKLLRMNCLSL